MANIVLVGAQWGDEGKGKIIDVITADVDWVVRYQGGSNAGHTVEVGDEEYILHLVPSGILRDEKKSIIGHGVVVDPLALVDELKGLEARGINTQGRLFVSDRAHMVFPYHRLLDAYFEQTRSGRDRIGTTKRGIGPAYVDKAARTGLRMGDLACSDFSSLVRQRVEENNRMLSSRGIDSLDPARVTRDFETAAQYLKPYVTDTLCLLHAALSRGETILLEGAQGTMLDIDYGTYPFVTSSNATAGGACTGSGIAPRHIDQVLGVVKAYTTRVGEGPFPTELRDERGRKFREKGKEYGATTGRSRRCGWFDAVVANYAALINGIDKWAMTKLDVLDHFETIKICTAYDYQGQRLMTIPADTRILDQCRPIYEEVEGWLSSTQDAKRFEDLPPGAQAYVKKIEEVTKVPVAILSIGPQRASTIVFEPASTSRLVPSIP